LVHQWRFVVTPKVPPILLALKGLSTALLTDIDMVGVAVRHDHLQHFGEIEVLLDIIVKVIFGGK